MAQSFTDQVRAALGDRYTIHEEVGRGGMGIVFRAVQRDTDRVVAIKVLRPEFVASVATDRWLREIAIVEQLDHPNILTVIESGRADGVLFAVMPFVDGESLKTRLEREQQLPIDEAVAIASQVAEAVGYAHEQGFVHRDLKPANILLQGDHAFVADFGIARAITVAGDERLTESGVALGTPQYMSPEQAAGRSQVDGRTDVYSIGCVLYEMLLGEPPFTGPTAQIVMARVLQETPRSVCVARPEVPRAVEHAIQKSLSKTPADRFKDSGEFASVLDQFVSGNYTMTIRLPRTRKGRGRLMAAGVVALGLSGLAVWRMRERVPELDDRRVVVFPAAVSGSDVVRGEDISTALSTVLDGVDAPVYQAWSWLSDSERLDPARISARRARRLAIARRGRYFITGQAVTRNDSATLTLSLHDVRGDSVIDTVTEQGENDTWRLTLRLAGQIVHHVASGSGVIKTARLRDLHVDAVTSYLLAEREYRRGRMERAFELYTAAVGADSGFAGAAIRAAQAAVWLYSARRPMGGVVGPLLATALRDSFNLTNRQVNFVRALSAYWTGDADAAVSHLRWALEADPDWPPAWMLLSEVYQNLGPSANRRDTLARHALEQVLELTPGFAPALHSLLVLSIQQRREGLVTDLFEEFVRTDPDSVVIRPIDMARRCVFDGVDTIDWRREVERAPDLVMTAVGYLRERGADFGCVQVALDAIARFDTTTQDAEWHLRQITAGVQLAHLSMLAGDEDAGFRRTVALADRYRSQELLYVLFAIAGYAVFDQSAAEIVEQESQEPFTDDLNDDEHLMLLWYVRTGDSIGVRRMSEALTVSGLPLAARSHMAELLEAWSAVMWQDTANAIDRLSTIPASGDPYQYHSAGLRTLAAERLTAAEMQMIRGYDREALELAYNVANGRSAGDLFHHRRALSLVAQAAGRLREVALARDASDRLSRIRGLRLNR